MLHIDAGRLHDSIARMAQIGATPAGGVTRLTLSDEDRQARDLLASWCREAGLELRVDRIGNMFARRPGREAGLPAILIGSHLDSQPRGGRYDGAFGVLAALEAVRTLNDAGTDTRHPIEIVNWTNEEATRFRPAPTGAGVFAGRILLEEALAAKDEAGAVLGDELARIGYAGEHPVGRAIAGYLEIHIEQGPVLEAAGVPIGVVLGNFGVEAREVRLTGSSAHIGTTPVHLRRDALLAAAEIVQGIRRLAEAHEPHGRATVARLEVHPNVRAIVAEQVELTADCRHHDPDALAAMSAEALRVIEAAASAHRLGLEIPWTWSLPAVPYHREWLKAIRSAADELGHTSMDLYSGAIHDAVEVGQIAPTALIFVPSRSGLSHHEAEYTGPEHLVAGAEVLLNALIAYDCWSC